MSDDSSVGPWVFGELPASSSSGDIRRASLDFSAGDGARFSSRNGGSSTASAAAGQLLQVHLEVVAAAPVQQLALHHRKGRRLPSLEAIDIIAGGCLVVACLNAHHSIAVGQEERRDKLQSASSCSSDITAGVCGASNEVIRQKLIT
jgi:hypothetical protein